MKNEFKCKILENHNDIPVEDFIKEVEAFCNILPCSKHRISLTAFSPNQLLVRWVEEEPILWLQEQEFDPEKLKAYVENAPKPAYQERVADWLEKCFESEIAMNITERNLRFIEESLELVQSLGLSKDHVLKMVDYTYGRPKGVPSQEVGGVMVTLHALGYASSLNIKQCGDAELARVWKKMPEIRAKQVTKQVIGTAVTDLEQKNISTVLEVKMHELKLMLTSFYKGKTPKESEMRAASSGVIMPDITHFPAYWPDHFKEFLVKLDEDERSLTSSAFLQLAHEYHVGIFKQHPLDKEFD